MCRWKSRPNRRDYCGTCSRGTRLGCEFDLIELKEKNREIVRGKKPEIICDMRKGPIKAFRMCGKEYPIHASDAGVFSS